MLADDDTVLATWFWNGSGMGTVDGVRPMTSLDLPAPVGYSVRLATRTDAPVLAALDIEHNGHYTQPPVLMAQRTAYDEGAWSAFLERRGNSSWLAEDEDGPFGFIRFDREFDGAEVTASADGVFVSGAYVRASHRRRGAGATMLDAALRRYAESGLAYCALDFEAFNPEATGFWMRYFTPVCYSVIRVPERHSR